MWTIDTGLNVIDAMFVGSNTWILKSFVASGSSDAYAQYAYHDDTGEIDVQVNFYTVPSGATFTIRYTK